MRSLAFITAAMVVFGGHSSFAQQMRPTIGARSPTAFGTINAGALGLITGGSIGRITSCATPGISGTPNTLFNATTADPITGALPSPILPGATLPTAPSFGGSIMSGTCDPTAGTRAVIEALGSSVSVTIPGLATIDASTYVDATIPPTATEAGAPGLSPQIIVPTPALPSPCVASATMPSITDPTAQAMASGTAVATSSGVASPSGC